LSRSLQMLALADFPLVQPGDDLHALVAASLAHNGWQLAHGDILAVAQKIVSKAEGRQVRLADVCASAEAQRIAADVDKDPRLVQLILDESVEVVRTRPGVIIVRHRLGYVHANAGIDRSNIQGADDAALLLPRDPDGSAAGLRQRFREQAGVEIGVIINDSAGRAWRNGTCGMAIGTAGFEPVQDLIGNKDLFGRRLEVTTVAVADELAAGASFLMGQAAEACPVVVIRGANLPRVETGSGGLIRKRDEDLFR